MAWSSLQDELDRWRESGLQATFWWRDDDATEVTPALERLLALAGGVGTPLTLAVIPASATERLARWLQDQSGVEVVQHGFSHRNHAADGGKKIELTARRPLGEVIDQLDEGRLRLGRLLGDRALPVLVPPWNRISEAVIDALPGLGYRGISTFGPRPGLPRRLIWGNTHVDPIDWRGTRGFAGESAVLESAVAHLRARRNGKADRSEPTGLLTHHLQHDQSTWAFCKRFQRETQRHPAVRWLSAGEVFELAETRELP